MNMNFSGSLIGMLCISLAIVVLPRSAYAQQSKPAQDFSSATTQDLIAKLQDESNQGIGTHATAWASGFMAIDDEPKFHGGIIGSAKPVVSPVMRELVRRGLAALPQLIRHLSDARPTKLTVGQGFMGKWFATEYDPRGRTPAKLPPGVTAPFSNIGHTPQGDFDNYTLKVGDLCFVAVGQIVNRQLNAVRYQPSMCLVVNSPLETPALAAAVKTDWDGLTPADHRRSLEEDALGMTTHPETQGEALKRLLFYYPDAGKPLAVRLLDRPFFDSTAVWNFVSQILLPAKDEARQDKLLADFRKQHGDVNYRGVERCLILASNFPPVPGDARQTRNAIAARKILQRLFPGVDPYHPPMLGAVTFIDEHNLVDALAPFHSTEIDAGIFQVLRRVAEFDTKEINDKFDQCDLALACAKRLTRLKDPEILDRAFRSLDFTAAKKDSQHARKLDQQVQRFLRDLVAQLTQQAVAS
jgi:hypothetical protein